MAPRVPKSEYAPKVDDAVHAHGSKIQEKLTPPEIRGNTRFNYPRCGYEDVDIVYSFLDGNRDGYLDQNELDSLRYTYIFQTTTKPRWYVEQSDFSTSPFLYHALIRATKGTFDNIPNETADFIVGRNKITIKGSNLFIYGIQQALQLLADKDPDTLTYIAKYISTIEESEKFHGMASDDFVPTFYLSKSDLVPSVETLASNIAHDARHAELYQQYVIDHPHQCVPVTADGGPSNEIICATYQLEVLRKLNANPWDIYFISYQIYYMGVTGHWYEWNSPSR